MEVINYDSKLLSYSEIWNKYKEKYDFYYVTYEAVDYDRDGICSFINLPYGFWLFYNHNKFFERHVLFNMKNNFKINQLYSYKEKNKICHKQIRCCYNKNSYDKEYNYTFLGFLLKNMNFIFYSKLNDKKYDQYKKVIEKLVQNENEIKLDIYIFLLRNEIETVFGNQTRTNIGLDIFSNFYDDKLNSTNFQNIIKLIEKILKLNIRDLNFIKSNKKEVEKNLDFYKFNLKNYIVFQLLTKDEFFHLNKINEERIIKLFNLIEENDITNLQHEDSKIDIKDTILFQNIITENYENLFIYLVNNFPNFVKDNIEEILKLIREKFDEENKFYKILLRNNIIQGDKSKNDLLSYAEIWSKYKEKYDFYYVSYENIDYNEMLLMYNSNLPYGFWIFYHHIDYFEKHVDFNMKNYINEENKFTINKRYLYKINYDDDFFVNLQEKYKKDIRYDMDDYSSYYRCTILEFLLKNFNMLFEFINHNDDYEINIEQRNNKIYNICLFLLRKEIENVGEGEYRSRLGFILFYFFEDEGEITNEAQSHVIEMIKLFLNFKINNFDEILNRYKLNLKDTIMYDLITKSILSENTNVEDMLDNIIKLFDLITEKELLDYLKKNPDMNSNLKKYFFYEIVREDCYKLLDYLIIKFPNFVKDNVKIILNIYCHLRYYKNEGYVVIARLNQHNLIPN